MPVIAVERGLAGPRRRGNEHTIDRTHRNQTEHSRRRHALRKRIIAARIDDQNIELIAGGRQSIGDALHAQRLRSDISPLFDVGVDRHEVVDGIVFQAVAGVIQHRHRLRSARPDLAREVVDVLRHALEVAVGGFRNLESELPQFLCDQARIPAGVTQAAEFDVVGVADHKRQTRCRLRHDLSGLTGGKRH